MRRKGDHSVLLSVTVLLLFGSPILSFNHPASPRQETQAGAALAASVSPVASFSLPQANAYPLGVTTDGSGNVWFAEDNSDSIVEFIPSNSTFHTFVIPTEHHLAWIWFLVFDTSGNIWFSDESQPLIWKFSPTTRTFANFSSDGAYPFSLSYEPRSGRIWFTSLRTEQVGYFVIDGGEASVGNVSTLHAPAPGAGPSGVLAVSGGDAYVSETFLSRIVELDGNTLSILRTWQLPNGSEPVGLAMDAPNRRLWFTNHASSFFGYVSLNSSGYREFPTSLFFTQGDYFVTLPYWIAVSSGGAVWFDEHTANRIARFDPKDQQLTEFTITTNESSPLRLALDEARGAVWFTEFSGNALGRIEENSSLGQGVGISAGKALGLPASFEATPSPGSVGPPVVGLTGSMTGEPGPGFSVSTRPSGGGYLVDVGQGNAVPGNYTAAVCFGYGVANQCGYVLLEVHEPQAFGPLTDAVYVAVAATAVAVLLALRREYRKGRKRPRPDLV